MRRALCLILSLVSAGAGAADFSGNARAWLGIGIDSNPRRDFVSPTISTPIDAFAGALISLNGTIDTEHVRLFGSYEIAGRKFILAGTEDTFIQSAFVDANSLLGQYFAVGISGRAKDRRGAQRDYTDLGLDGYVEFTPDPHIVLKVRAGPHRFLYWNLFSSSYWGPSAGVSVLYRFNKRHSAFLLSDFEPHSHNANACVRIDTGDPNEVLCQFDPAPPRRSDAVISVAAGYTFRGPFHLTAQYAYIDSSSNSFAETWRRHRVSATFGLRLPWDFTLLLAGAVQFANYPEGLRLINAQPGNPDLKVAEDDENANYASLKLIHPLGKHFDIDFRFAFYFNQLGGYSYRRAVGSLGVGWKW